MKVGDQPPEPLTPPDDGRPFFVEELDRSETARPHVHDIRFTLRAEFRDPFRGRAAELVREAIVDPADLERLGDAEAAAFLRSRLPEGKSTRGGDLGEILTAEYMRTALGALVTYRLRDKPNVEMPLHGIDNIGVRLVNGRPIVYKAESKLGGRMGKAPLTAARTKLEADGGLLRAESLSLLMHHHRRDHPEVFDALAIESATRARGRTHHVIFLTFGEITPNGVEVLVAALSDDNRTFVAALQIDALTDFVAEIYELLKGAA